MIALFGVQSDGLTAAYAEPAPTISPHHDYRDHHDHRDQGLAPAAQTGKDSAKPCTQPPIQTSTLLPTPPRTPKQSQTNKLHVKQIMWRDTDWMARMKERGSKRGWAEAVSANHFQRWNSLLELHQFKNASLTHHSGESDISTPLSGLENSMQHTTSADQSIAGFRVITPIHQGERMSDMDEAILWWFLANQSEEVVRNGIIQTCQPRPDRKSGSSQMLSQISPRDMVMEMYRSLLHIHGDRTCCCKAEFMRQRLFFFLLTTCRTELHPVAEVAWIRSSINDTSFTTDVCILAPAIPQNSIGSSPWMVSEDCCKSFIEAYSECLEFLEAWSSPPMSETHGSLVSGLFSLASFERLPALDKILLRVLLVPTDIELAKYFAMEMNDCVNSGELLGIVLGGLSNHERAMALLKNRVELTGDVQNAYIISLALDTLSPSQFELRSRWLDVYVTLLDRWKLWKARAHLEKVSPFHTLLDDIHVPSNVSIVSPVDVNCYYCDQSLRFSAAGPKRSVNTKSIGMEDRLSSGIGTRILSIAPVVGTVKSTYGPFTAASGLGTTSGLSQGSSSASSALTTPTATGGVPPMPTGSSTGGGGDPSSSTAFGKLRISCCAKCGKQLPRCAVCLVSLDMANPTAERALQKSRTVSLSPSESSSAVALSGSDLNVASASGGDIGSVVPTAKSSDMFGPGSVADNSGNILKASPRSLVHSSSIAMVSIPSAVPVSSWICWCVNCGHGGHTQHIMEWHALHTKCPVSGCLCHCPTAS